QRISDGSGLALQLLGMVLEKRPDPEKSGGIDIFSGWDPSPGSVTPKADLVSTRATTFQIGGNATTSGSLLVTIIAVPPEHGGPGLFVSLGGTASIKRTIGDDGTLQVDAGFPNAFDMFIPFGSSAKMPFTAHGDGTTPFLKLA